MKKEYQIEKAQAVEGFRACAEENQEPLQLTLATSEIAQLAQQSLGDLLRQVGRQFIEAVMEADVEQLVGMRSEPNAERGACRWGAEDGFCIIDSQRVRLKRPRVRSRDNRELPLDSYELFQRGSLLTETVWQKTIHGLRRNCKEVVQQFAEAYGLEKSTISEHFVEAGRRKLQQLLTRSLKDVQLCKLLVDGPFSLRINP